MDGQRFDQLARLIGTRAPRRRVLKLLGGGFFGLAGGLGARTVPRADAQSGGFGDACSVDGDCDQQALLTCDDDRSTCRGGTGYPCFDTGDCSTADGLLCVDETGTECTSEEFDCGTCGTAAPACAGEGESCRENEDCCPAHFCNRANQCQSVEPTCAEFGGLCDNQTLICCDGLLCREDGICVECESDEDCDDGEVCNDDGACEIPCQDEGESCASSDDCCGDLVCGDDNVCAECASDDDCDDDETCKDGVCTEVDDEDDEDDEDEDDEKEPTKLPATGVGQGDTGSTPWLGAAAVGAAAAFLAGKKVRDRVTPGRPG